MSRRITAGRSRRETETRHRINAGRVCLRNQLPFFRAQFGQVASEWKEDDTRVTFADFAISEKIFGELGHAFPHDALCSEESNPADEVIDLTRTDFAWVLDPIDGTNNYALGIPFCAISLGLLYRGMPVYGFVFDYARNRLIEGGPGFGVTDGASTARVAPGPLDSQSIVSLHFPLSPEDQQALAGLMGHYRIRCLGSGTLNLAYAAIGKTAGVIDFKVKVWDIAAATALIQGAGGEIAFLSEPVFPLHAFHVTQPHIRYYGGTPAFCRYVRGLF